MQSHQPNRFAQAASFRQGHLQRGVAVPNSELAVEQNPRSRQ